MNPEQMRKMRERFEKMSDEERERFEKMSDEEKEEMRQKWMKRQQQQTGGSE
jgi:uncharacterized damage-inducible protein DinB